MKVNRLVGAEKINTLEGEVKQFGETSAHIVLPKTWRGKLVRVKLVETAD